VIDIYATHLFDHLSLNKPLLLGISLKQKHIKDEENELENQGFLLKEITQSLLDTALFL
jgi:hypothetical protein